MADFANLVIGVNTAGLTKGQRALDATTAAGVRTGRAAKSATVSMATMGSVAGGAATKGLLALKGSALAAGAALLGIGAAVSVLREFETSVSRMGAISGATTAQLAAMRDVAQDLGSTTEFSATQAADGLTFLAMAGFNASEAIASIPAVLDLATASGMGLSAAADTASNIMSGFGIAATDAAKVTDILAAASSRSNTSVSQLGAAMSTVAPIASALDISLADTAAALGVLADAGIQGERGGTAFRGVLASLAGPTSQAEDVIKKLGLTISEVDPATNSLSIVMGRLGDAGLSTADAMTIFGREAASGALVMVEGASRLREFGDELGNVDGAASDMADTIRDNLGGDIDGLLSAVSGLIIALGDAGLTAILRGVVTSITELARFVTGLVDGFGNLVDMVTGVFGFATANEALARAAGQAAISMQVEFEVAGDLLDKMQDGRTMSVDYAGVKLAQARAHLASADAQRQELLASVKNSKEFQRQIEAQARSNRELAAYYEFREQAAAQGEIEGAADAERYRVIIEGLQQAVRLQKEMLATVGDIGPEAAALNAQIDFLEEAMTKAVDGVITFGDRTRDASEITEVLARLSSSVDFTGAAQSAQSLANWLGISLSNALQLSMLTPEMSDEDAAMAGNVIPDAGQRARNRSAIANLKRLTAPPPATGGVGGGEGASDAARAAEKLRNDNQRELEQITNGLATAQDKYNTGLEQAQRLLDAEVLGPEVYAQHVAQLRQELTDAEWADSGLKPFIDDLSQAGLSMESLADVFQNAIARMAKSWLSSGLTSLGQSFMGIGGGQSGGDTAGLLGGIPSFSGGGFTGNGARSGGLDGQGGFLAINHPQETITDHTRGQSSSQAPVINITVNGARGNAEIAEMVGIGVSAGIQQNNKRIATAQGRPT